MQMREIMTVDEAADFLRVCRRTLEYMRRDGRGPSFVHLGGRRIGYRRSDIDQWIEQRTEQRAA